MTLYIVYIIIYDTTYIMYYCFIAYIITYVEHARCTVPPPPRVTHTHNTKASPIFTLGAFVYFPGGVSRKPKKLIQQQERIKSRAYVRSQMQFLMVLASTESHVTQDVMPAHAVAGGPGQAAEGVGVEKDWSSDSGSGAQGTFGFMPAASNSSSLAFQPVSMLKSNTWLADTATGVMLYNV